MARPQYRGARLAMAVAMAFSMMLAVPLPAAAHPEVCDGKESETASSAAFELASSVLNVVNLFAGVFPTQAPAQESSDEGCFTEAEVAAMDDSGATLAPGDTASSPNVTLLANLPKSGPFEAYSAFGSDLAFWGRYAFQGNYNGFQITDVSDRANPSIVSQVNCPGSQNDISVWKNLVVTSTDSRRNDDSCNSFALGTTTTPSSTDPNAEYWEGLKIFDWSNPADPRLVTTVETDCGSHTHTILPEEDRVLVYVSSYDINPNAKDCRSTGSPNDHDKISIVEIPLDNPQAASVIAEPVLFPDGGNPGNAYTRPTRGCHDITVYQAKKLAAGACMGEGVIMDISDPVSPKVLSSVRDDNFAFWHSATFSNDGRTVVFTDELGGGGSPTCNPTVGPTKGADGIYDVTDPNAPVFASYFKIPRTQSNSENCVAHNGNVMPVPGRDVMVQAWYQGGLSIFDFTDPYNPRELGWFERGPYVRPDTGGAGLSGGWSTYWYNGNIFTNEIQQGLDVHTFADRTTGLAANLPYLNAQTQEPPPRRR